MDKNHDLKAITVLITGGGKGLGKAISEAFAEVGANLIISGRTEEPLRRIADEFHSKGISASVVQMDITKPESVKNAVREISSNNPQIDILVNNAGGFAAGALGNFSDEEWDKIIRLNLYGPFYVTKYFLPLLQKAPSPHIFFINSIGGRIGMKNVSAYAASKSGVRGFAESLSEEFRKEGFKITSVFPHMMNSAYEDISDDKRMKMIETADVARQIVSIASSPGYVNIPEITIYPMSSGIVKRDNLT
ncbi:MAG: SDR family NAD(P)-dependent oxidoreductase [candidate division Zixibacteria bacterium]|nr:SDR family NAD(P)-dependent oxidoreductase [candidate division Zixibacteria bacterium]